MLIPTTTPSGRISNELEEERREKRERKKEREKNAICSDHLRLSQQPRAAHALRSDQNDFKTSKTHLNVDG